MDVVNLHCITTGKMFEEVLSDPSELFTLEEKIGEGSFGSVYKAVETRYWSGIFVSFACLEICNDTFPNF